MALIPIYCSNESCKHLGFVSVETLPRALTCSSCGVQTLHAPPPVTTSKWRPHQTKGRRRKRYSYAAA
jgi:hypothetical protein